MKALGVSKLLKKWTLLIVLIFTSSACARQMPLEMSDLMDKNRTEVIRSLVDQYICPAAEQDRSYEKVDGSYWGVQNIQCLDASIKFFYTENLQADHFDVISNDKNSVNGMFQFMNQFAQNKWSQWPLQAELGKPMILSLFDSTLIPKDMNTYPFVEVIEAYQQYRIQY